jgi:hypothetical protein
LAPAERPLFTEILEQTQFKILPGIDSSSAAAFLLDVHLEID